MSKEELKQFHSTVKIDDVRSDDVIASAVVLALCGWEKRFVVVIIVCECLVQLLQLVQYFIKFIIGIMNIKNWLFFKLKMF